MSDPKQIDMDDWWKLSDAIINSGLNNSKDIKCECGSSVTLGKDDHPSLHSDYCPLKKQFNSGNENDSSPPFNLPTGLFIP